jgi:integrase
MSTTASTLGAEAEDASRWRRHLGTRIDPSWRPGEYDHRRLLWIPAGAEHRSCRRGGCGRRPRHGELCPGCRRERSTTAEHGAGCLVGCRRFPEASGLCASHHQRWQQAGRRAGHPVTVSEWIGRTGPAVLPAVPPCVVPGCGRDRRSGTGLCARHRAASRRWIAGWNREHPGLSADVDLWLERRAEPLEDDSGTGGGSPGAVLFGLMPGTSGLELVMALQCRDGEGRHDFGPTAARAVYLHMRRYAVPSFLALEDFARSSLGDSERHVSALASDVVRRVAAEHRRWSGIDERDPRLIHLAELDLTDHRRPGPRATADLRGFRAEWIVAALTHWLRHTRLNTSTAVRMVGVWRLADEVLAVRDRPPDQLGASDMDAVVRAVHSRWDSVIEQRRRLQMLWRLIAYAHRVDELADEWDRISLRFGKNPATHRPRAAAIAEARPEADEPYRFVPQPIVDWLMDHLDLLHRADDYRTMEARALIFVHERCGRRPAETLHLRHECLSYDSSGHPFLEWHRIKPPKYAGKRIPIHQQTHDLIRHWHQVKAEYGIVSPWLFPSIRHRGGLPYSHCSGLPYATEYLTRRIRDLVTAVQQHAPFPGMVPGADGNLIHYDPTVIDAYALRHAYAQRYADAVDGTGRSTTSPDVLQELMDHKSFTTTMTYYEVGATRRKAALAAIAPRRLDFLGNAVEVNRERDGFTRVPVSLGHCEEPQNVALGGAGCMLSHACESCPYFRVDPLERDGMVAKRSDLKVQLERATVINAAPHMLDHFRARIAHCDAIIDGIDHYLTRLPDTERRAVTAALNAMADIRHRATTPRRIDLRAHLKGPAQP